MDFDALIRGEILCKYISSFLVELWMFRLDSWFDPPKIFFMFALRCGLDWVWSNKGSLCHAAVE